MLTLGIWVALAVVAVVFATGILRRRDPTPSPSEAPPSTVSAPASSSATAPPGPAPAPIVVDGALMFEVQRILDNSTALRGSRVKVEAVNGIVTLTGEVPSAAAGELAVTLARTVAGASRVFSALQVEPPAASASTAYDASRAAPPSLPAEPAPTPNPTAEKVRDLLGRARRELDADNPKGAEPLFEEVLGLDPANEIARGALERLRADAARGPRRPGGPPPR